MDLNILHLLRKAPIIRRRFGYSGNPWSNPPERNTKGFLTAYGEIYSLFGIALRIATAVGEVKWRLYKGSERSERSQVADHPILTLLDFANEFQTGQEIIELTQLHMDLAGKAYWYLPKNGLGVPGEIWVMPPHLMKIAASEKDFITGYVFQCGSEQVPFDKSEIIRFPMPDPVNPRGGIGYAQPAAVELDTEAYAGKWNRNFFYNSARADAVIEADHRLNEEQYEQLRTQWKGQHQGVSRAHKIGILEEGLTYKQIQISQKDMDFPNLRKQTRENLMFTFGIPLSVMGITENVNRANAEAGEYTFAKGVIKPRLTRIKNKLNEQLLPMFPLAKGVEIDFDEVVPETIEQKKGLAESGVKAGYMTINEGRKLVGLDPIPTGDQLLIPMNLFPTPIKQFQVSKSFTDDQKEAYWQGYAAKTARQESFFKTRLKDLFDDQEKEAVKQLRASGQIEDSLFDSEQTRDKFDEGFRPLIENVYGSALEEAVSDLKQLSPLALEWIAARSLALAMSINETTKLEIRKQLATGLAEGESIPKLTKRIRTYYGDAFKRRAPMVARTEVIAASNEGALRGYEEQGVQKAEFYPAPDACPECVAEVGIYPVDEAHGKIPVHPNCRCVFLPVVE